MTALNIMLVIMAIIASIALLLFVLYGIYCAYKNRNNSPNLWSPTTTTTTTTVGIGTSGSIDWYHALSRDMRNIYDDLSRQQRDLARIIVDTQNRYAHGIHQATIDQMARMETLRIQSPISINLKNLIGTDEEEIKKAIDDGTLKKVPKPPKPEPKSRYDLLKEDNSEK